MGGNEEPRGSITEFITTQRMEHCSLDRATRIKWADSDGWLPLMLMKLYHSNLGLFLLGWDFHDFRGWSLSPWPISLEGAP